MKRPSPKRKTAPKPLVKPSERGPVKGPRVRVTLREETSTKGQGPLKGGRRPHQVKGRDQSKGREQGQGQGQGSSQDQDQGEARGRSDRGPRRPAMMMPERREEPQLAPRVPAHVASLPMLARATVEAARIVERVVLDDKKHADRAISHVLKERRDLGQLDKMFISQAIFALFRWKGWLESLPIDRTESRLLFAWLLDAPSVHPACRIWAESINRDPARLFSLGGAPNWTARAEGWKRLHEEMAVTADPWRLFPTWLRDHMPLPPGSASPKMKNLEFLHALQARPSIWVRAQGTDPKAVWAELSGLGLRPWIHRRVLSAARLNAESNIHHLAPFKEGRLEIQDLASQAVGFACDPDPGERWWDACSGAGGKAIHLAGLMQGKGLVVASDVNESKLKEAVRRARRSPFRNLTTKVWDGKHIVGKPGSFDGVLVDAPCSAMGTWRRNPDARWTLDKEAIPRLAALQAQLLRTASIGVRKGGTLVYSVCTVTPSETVQVIRPFLAEHPEFKLDPFPHPLTGEPTDGTLLIWPQESDNDAMFIARMVRSS